MNIDASAIGKDMARLKRKDPVLFHALEKKILQIASCDSVSITRFKNLRHGMSDFKRVHIGSFVLVFRVKEDTVIFEQFRRSRGRA